VGKVLKVGLAIAGIAIAFVPGVGTAVSGAMTALFSGTAVGAGGSFLAASIAGTITSSLAVAGVVTGLSMGAKALGLGPKPPRQSPASQDRLRASLDPRAFRKMVLGHTAAATDVGYQEFTGTDQEYLNTILVLASHPITALEEVFFDEKQAWTGAAIGSDFTGYLSLTSVLEGTDSNSFTITGSTSWTAANSRLVGCAYLWLRYKLTGNSKKAESPFSSAVSSRITVRVKGAPLYDPRLDTTVGGSGSHRADDQSTWAWVSDDVGRNPALQLLWYLLGWRIQNPDDSSFKLAVGLGLPVERIDLPSFMAAANLCDEPVTLSGGGTEPRYRSDGVFSEGDDPQLVFENLLSAMNGTLRDAGGKLSLDVLHNDLATPVIDLTEADVIGEFTWIQTPPVDQEFNVVRGRYVDPGDEALYQFADYPEVAIASEDGIERPRSFDLPMVQSPGQAQRLAKQFLQRAQYPGTFAADFLASAWRCQVGSVVTLTFPALGFSEKLFRVVEHAIQFSGTCAMVLREENAAIYAWDSEDAAAVTAAAPIAYDPLNDPLVRAISEQDQGRIRLAAVLNPRDGSDVARPLLTATDAGASATISVAKHDWDYPDSDAVVTRALGTITGLSFSTTYHVYFDDETLADTTVTYAATTDLATALNSATNTARHFLGTITTPANGATDTANPGTNGAGGQSGLVTGMTVQQVIAAALVQAPRDAGDAARALLIATDAGATATISVAKHDWDYPVGIPDVTRALASITGLAFSTTYYVYFDDATLANASPTYAATTTFSEALNSSAHPVRHYLGSVSTPADGGAAVYAPGIGGAGGQLGLVVGNVFENDFNLLTPDTPTSLSALSIVTNTDGTISAKITWDFTRSTDPTHKNSIDKFRIRIWAADTNAAHTLGTDGEEDFFDWEPIPWSMYGTTFEAWILLNRAPNKYYTYGVSALRWVNSSLKESRVVESAIVQAGPTRPASTHTVGGLMVIGGQTATDVGSGASKANTALTSSGNVASGTKVGGDSGQVASDVSTATQRGLVVMDASNNITAGTKIGGSGGLTATTVSDYAGRAGAAITSGNKAATNVVETISLTSETVTHLFAGSTSSTPIALDGGSYGTYVSVASSSFTVQEGGADVLFLGLVSVRFGITATDSNLQFTATARITFDGVNSNTFEVTQTVSAAGRNTTVPIVASHLFEGVAAGSRTFTLAIKVDDPSGTWDYAETRGVRAVQIMELKR